MASCPPHGGCYDDWCTCVVCKTALLFYSFSLLLLHFFLHNRSLVVVRGTNTTESMLWAEEQYSISSWYILCICSKVSETPSSNHLQMDSKGVRVADDAPSFWLPCSSKLVSHGSAAKRSELPAKTCSNPVTEHTSSVSHSSSQWHSPLFSINHLQLWITPLASVVLFLFSFSSSHSLVWWKTLSER